MRKAEQMLRHKVLQEEGISRCLHFSHFEGKDTVIKECTICKYDCYLSAVVCPCSPEKMACLRHSTNVMISWHNSDITSCVHVLRAENSSCFVGEFRTSMI